MLPGRETARLAAAQLLEDERRDLRDFRLAVAIGHAVNGGGEHLRELFPPRDEGLRQERPAPAVDRATLERFEASLKQRRARADQAPAEGGDGG